MGSLACLAENNSPVHEKLDMAQDLNPIFKRFNKIKRRYFSRRLQKEKGDCGSYSNFAFSISIIHWFYSLNEVRNIKFWTVWQNTYKLTKSGDVHIQAMRGVNFSNCISIFKYHFRPPNNNRAVKIYKNFFKDKSLHIRFINVKKQLKSTLHRRKNV